MALRIGSALNARATPPTARMAPPWSYTVWKHVKLGMDTRTCRTHELTVVHALTWKNLVWKRVKLTPTLRSNSWRASTACASASLGDTSEDWQPGGEGQREGVPALKKQGNSGTFRPAR